MFVVASVASVAPRRCGVQMMMCAVGTKRTSMAVLRHQPLHHLRSARTPQYPQQWAPRHQQQQQQRQPQRRNLSSSEDTVVEETTRTYAERLDDAKTMVPIGMFAVAVGITVLTLNERRDVAQHALTEKARHVCETYDSNVDATPHARLNGHLLHTSGWVDAVAPLPVDNDLHVSAPAALRLKRTTEMYQWIEHSSTATTQNKDGSETKTTTYSYSLDWKESHCNVTQAAHKKNPPFPTRIKSTIFEAGGGLHLGKVCTAVTLVCTSRRR